jgi:predicted O-methyltransferase YrrM
MPPFAKEPGMTPSLAALKAELEQFGHSNDQMHTERARRMLNITRDTGELLGVLVRATQSRRILEIGTSNGYSTLWLAEAARDLGGTVTTVELAAAKVQLAQRTFERSGLAPCIHLRHEDAAQVLENAEAGAFDLVFLDSERPEYPGWWPHLRRVLRPGGLLVVDNATSHPKEMVPFMALVNTDPDFTTCLATVGNGEFMAVKNLA